MGGELGWRLASSESGRGHDEVIRVWESATGRRTTHDRFATPFILITWNQASGSPIEWDLANHADGSLVCVASAMQSISLRSTEPVICLVQCETFLKEFAKFFKTAKVRQVIWRADS